MVSLGEIARQAGVRPSLDLEKALSGIASGTAVVRVPQIHEPSPIMGTSSNSTDTATGLEIASSVYLAGGERSSERSASAIDFYEKTVREAEAISGQPNQGEDMGFFKRKTQAYTVYFLSRFYYFA